MKPNEKNFCGGNFQDWLEVNLTSECNGSCSWCIERNGFRPSENAEWWVIVSQALASNKTNIILLGGEPTLHPDLQKIIRVISSSGRKVWITTNGGLLDPVFVFENLVGITGINISLHDFDVSKNKLITGVAVHLIDITIEALHAIGANVRLNCNCIQGHIDSIEQIESYILWAKSIGADKIRFAELKQDDGGFVDLAKLFNHKYGLNDNPFLYGCNSDAVIHGIPVNFRQMCGLQTSRREKPTDPIQCVKQVLYYDGKFYDGWQTNIKEEDVQDKDIVKILREVEAGKLTSEEAFAQLKGIKEKEIIREVVRHESSGGCQY